jgi:hypothetical protein
MPVQEPSNVAIHGPQRANHLLMMQLGSRTDFDDAGQVAPPGLAPSSPKADP